MGVTGDVAILSTEEALGFTTEGGGQANWIAIVRGDVSTHIVPGCKVNSVTYSILAESYDYVAVP